MFVFVINMYSVQFSHSVVSDSLRPHGLQHRRLPCPAPTPGVYSNSCPFSWWCYPTTSSFVVPFSSHLQSFPEFSSVQFSRSVVSDSLWSHESQHARPPCPSPTPGVYPNSCPVSQWCHSLLLPSIFPSIRAFSDESALRMRWPKYWSFSFNISPSNDIEANDND